MPDKTPISVVESPAHPELSALYRRQGITGIKPRPVRDAIEGLKKQPPDHPVTGAQVEAALAAD